MEKVTGIGGIILSSQRSESVGELVPTAPGRFADSIEGRGSGLGAGGWPHRFHSFSGDDEVFRRWQQGLDGELSSPGHGKDGGPAPSCGGRD